jgi:hypothetical protein
MRVSDSFVLYCFGFEIYKNKSTESINLFHSGLEKALERLGKQNIELKECQYEARKAVVVDRKDTSGVLPTGLYGKSLNDIYSI